VTLSVEKDLVQVSIQLCVIEHYLKKPFNDWTVEEKEEHKDKEQLRKKEEQLRDERKQLRDERKQLRTKEEQLRTKEEQLLEQQTIQLRIKEKTISHTEPLNHTNGPAFLLMVDLFKDRFRFDGKSTSVGKRAKFRPRLARDYLKIDEKAYHNGASITCQILDVVLPNFLVIGAHIFKHEWASDAKILLGIDNIDSTRNGLLLLQPIEKAFDRSRLCFLKGRSQNSFCLKILDPALREQDLLASCLPYITEAECKKLESSFDDVRNSLANSLTIDGRQLTFGDLEGRALICKGKTRPYKRCLNFHASRARDYAVEMKWISANVTFEYQWSEHFDQEGLEKYLETLGTSFEDLDVNSYINDMPIPVDNIAPNDAVDESDSDCESHIS